MDGFDKETAARVWDRVRCRDGAAAPAAPESPDGLMFQSHELAGLYLGMQRRFPGSAGQQIRELYRQHRSLTACLRGMHRVKEGVLPGLPPMRAGSGSIQSLLTGCYHRERRLGDALARLASQGEVPPVYGLLARQAAERCVILLALLGGE